MTQTLREISNRYKNQVYIVEGGLVMSQKGKERYGELTWTEQKNGTYKLDKKDDRKEN